MQEELNYAKRIMRSSGAGLTLVYVVGLLGILGMIVAVFAVFATLGHETIGAAATAAFVWFVGLFVATAYAFGLAAVITLLREIYRIQFRAYAARKSSGAALVF